jgi:hypothetical protein
VSEQQSLGAMVKGVTEDISTLVRGEIELAKTELRDSAKTAANGGVLLVAAGVMAFLGLVFLLLTLAWVLVQLGLPTWAGFGIVTLLLILITVILGLVGKKRLDSVQGPVRSPASIEKSKAVLSRKPAVDPTATDLATPDRSTADRATPDLAPPVADHLG